MGEQLDGSRQSAKDIFFYLASPEFLANRALGTKRDRSHSRCRPYLYTVPKEGSERNDRGGSRVAAWAYLLGLMCAQ